MIKDRLELMLQSNDFDTESKETIKEWITKLDKAEEFEREVLSRPEVTSLIEALKGEIKSIEKFLLLDRKLKELERWNLMDRKALYERFINVFQAKSTLEQEIESKIQE